MIDKTRALAVSGTLLAATALAAGGVVTSAGPADAATARPPACTGHQLGLHVNTRGMGAAGHDGLTLEFRNHSHRTCTVTGYPGVDAMVGRHRLSSAKRVAGPIRVRTIVVKPRHWTSALVDWNTVGPDGKPCAGGTSLEVTAPNTDRTRRVHEATGCKLEVHPVVAGRRAGLTG